MKLNKYIDHTLLKATARKEEIETLCKEAKEFDFFSVCVSSSYIEFCKEQLRGTDVKIAAVVGFPLGSMSTEAKVFEAKDAIEKGANEIDMVLNISRLLDGDYSYVEDEIRAIKEVIGSNTLKVILENCYLDKKDIVKACQLAVEAGADYVKTSTGFGSGGATFEDVELMKSVVKQDAKVKASGGVRDKESALKYIELGAERLGTSSGIAIMKDEVSNSIY